MTGEILSYYRSVADQAKWLLFDWWTLKFWPNWRFPNWGVDLISIWTLSAAGTIRSKSKERYLELLLESYGRGISGRGKNSIGSIWRRWSSRFWAVIGGPFALFYDLREKLGILFDSEIWSTPDSPLVRPSPHLFPRSHYLKRVFVAVSPLVAALVFFSCNALAL